MSEELETVVNNLSKAVSSINDSLNMLNSINESNLNKIDTLVDTINLVNKRMDKIESNFNETTLIGGKCPDHLSDNDEVKRLQGFFNPIISESEGLKIMEVSKDNPMFEQLMGNILSIKDEYDVDLPLQLAEANKEIRRLNLVIEVLENELSDLGVDYDAAVNSIQ